MELIDDRKQYIKSLYIVLDFFSNSLSSFTVDVIHRIIPRFVIKMHLVMNVSLYKLKSERKTKIETKIKSRKCKIKTNEVN